MPRLNTLTVYLGSSGHTRPVFRDASERLGQIIGESGRALAYGGMDSGLMGLLAVSAMNAGAQVTGIIPQNFKDSERILGGLSKTILVGDLSERKKLMFQMADAVIVLPGGFGTLDESLEVLYWANMDLHSKPLALVNIENYWGNVINYLRRLPDFRPEFLIVAENIESVVAALESWNGPSAPITLQERFPHFEDEISRDTDEPIIIDKASIENAYYGVCALGLKQLGKTKRPIGFLNKDGQFDALLKWIQRAHEEKFITDNCLKLFSVAGDEESLRSLLKNQNPVEIDLHSQKWGERRGTPR